MIDPRHARITPLALFALALSTPALHAQFRASIQGTVADPTGAVIPNAQVTLLDLDTSRSVSATSNASGLYTFNALPTDHYRITVSAPGFTTKTLDNVAITPEQSNAINIALVAEGATQTVNVTAGGSNAIETETATISGTVNSNQIQHLPSAGRDIFQLSQLAPGSFGDMSQGAGGGTSSLPGTQGPGGTGSTGLSGTTENGPQTLAAGGQYETNGISIDGISTASAVWGGTSIITPNEDSVDNIHIVSQAYDAENGRFSGAQMQVTSKSGSNQVHGSAYIRLFRPGLDAYQRYNGGGAPVRDNTRQNDVGGSLGGPLWKNKLFAFFAYETIRNNSSTLANNWFDTPQFDALANTNGGPIAKSFLGFAGNGPNNPVLVQQTCAAVGLVQGTNCFDTGQGLNLGSPITTGVGTQDLTWRSTSNPGVGGGLNQTTPTIALYETSNPTTSTYEQYNGRADADVTKNDRLTFALYWVPYSSQNYEGYNRGYNLWNHSQVNEAYSIIWNHTFSPTLLNEARVNDAGWRWNEIDTNPQEPFGLPIDTIGQTGTIGQPNGIAAINFGPPGPSVFNQHTFTYKDTLTKVAGNHNIRMGGEVTRLYYLDNPTYAARPEYSFFNIWDFLNDAPNSETGQFSRFTGTPVPNRYDTRENLWGGFVQDDWKVRPNLTLNLGLRYSYFDSLYAKQNNVPAVRFGAGSALFTGMSVSTGGHLWNPQPRNFGPQFGFAYSPDAMHGKMVVRGGYGLNYNQEEIAISGNFAGNPGDVVTPNYTSGSPTTINGNILYSVASDTSSLYGYPANPNTITSYQSNGLPTTTGLNLTGFPTNLRTAYTQHFSLDTQVDLGHAMVATVGYQGALAHHLISQQNLYVYGAYHGDAFNPQITSVDYYGDYGASDYSALLATLKHTMQHNFTVEADYTYAKSMDDGSGPYEEDPYPYNNALAWGRSDFNFGQAVKVYGLWQPTFGATHGWVNKVAGGWSLSGIYNYHTGFPWTPVSTGSAVYYSQSGYSTLRPAAYNGAGGRDTSNKAFKPNAAGNSPNFVGGGTPFFTAPTYTTTTYPAPPTDFPVPGISRNSFTGPNYMDFDGTLTKAFGLPNTKILGENASFEIRADAFNLFNLGNLNVADISTNIASPNFGTVTAGGGLGSRTINIQGRFSF